MSSTLTMIRPNFLLNFTAFYNMLSKTCYMRFLSVLHLLITRALQLL